MKKVLILGGNGFIGTNLTKYLIQRGEQITSFDLKLPSQKIDNVCYIHGNFDDEDKLDQITDGIDIIFHAISSINPGTSNHKYMQGYAGDFIQTIKLCNLVREKNIKMIFLSSCGTVYGNQVVQPIKETASANPINHYGNVKLCIENTMKIFNRQNGTNIKVARISNPYGPGQDFKKGVGFIDAVLKGGLNHSTVEIYGDGNVVRDYIYIEDVCKMLTALMEYEGPEEIFNLSSGTGTSQNQIIGFAKKWIPDLKVRYLDSRSIDADTIVLDNTKIHEICGIKPVNIFEGMYSYLQYLKCHIQSC